MERVVLSNARSFTTISPTAVRVDTADLYIVGSARHDRRLAISKGRRGQLASPARRGAENRAGCGVLNFQRDTLLRLMDRSGGLTVEAVAANGVRPGAISHSNSRAARPYRTTVLSRDRVPIVIVVLVSSVSFLGDVRQAARA
jgi:hypothetical protein